jgi:hypothetical protein
MRLDADRFLQAGRGVFPVKGDESALDQRSDGLQQSLHEQRAG